MSTAPYEVNDADDIRDALGIPQGIEYRGKTWQLKALDLFDYMELSQRFGGMSRVNIAHDPEAILYTVYLMLRKADPDLTDADRKARRWALTLESTADLFSLDSPAGSLELIAAVRDRSGLLGPRDPQEADPKNMPAAPGRGRRKSATPGAA